MGRQFRTPRAPGLGGGGGNIREFVGPAPSTVTPDLVIPAYGVTDLSTWGASTYTMAPPVAGAVKTFISHSSAPAARVVKLSTANTVTTSYPGGPTTGASGNTHISFAASTLDTCLTLMGINSTHWMIVSVHPALNSTGTSITST